jgi:hypothetical protein
MASIFIAPTRLGATCTFDKVLRTAETLLMAQLNLAAPVRLSAELQAVTQSDQFQAVVPDAVFVWRRPALELLWVDCDWAGSLDPISVLLHCETFTAGELTIHDFEEAQGTRLDVGVRSAIKEANAYWYVNVPSRATSEELAAHHALVEAIATSSEGLRLTR